VVAGLLAIRSKVFAPRALLSAVIEAVPCSFMPLVLLLLRSFSAYIAGHTLLPVITVAMRGATRASNYCSDSSRIVPTRAYIMLLMNFFISTAHARQHRSPMRRENASKEIQ